MGLRVKVTSLENLSESQIEELVIIQVRTCQCKTQQFTEVLYIYCHKIFSSEISHREQIKYFSSRKNWSNKDLPATSQCIWETFIKLDHKRRGQHFCIQAQFLKLSLNFCVLSSINNVNIAISVSSYSIIIFIYLPVCIEDRKRMECVAITKIYGEAAPPI